MFQMGLSLLANSRPSLKPQSFAGNLGMAGLQTIGMQRQQKLDDMKRKLIEAQTGLAGAKTIEALMGEGSSPTAATPRGKVIQDYNNGLISKEIMDKRLGELDATERRNVNESASKLRAERDKTTAPISAGLQSIRAAEALLNSDNPFGDVASLTSFIKSVDNSVVRPSEMDAYNASVGLLNQIESVYQRAKGDGVLTPASRQALRASLQGLRENYQTILEGQNEFYRSESTASGIDPARVLREVDPGKVEASTKEPYRVPTSTEDVNAELERVTKELEEVNRQLEAAGG
jgi:hypothetical protein